ncbi:MAG: hypothetical protein ACHP65_02755 [Legionellales bacterium]
MNPIINRLRRDYLGMTLSNEEASLNWLYTDHIKQLGPDFYAEKVALLPVLQLEYSISCQQLAAHLPAVNAQNVEKMVEQLISALILAELLEHLYRYYFNVPRDVARVRKQQLIYKNMLSQLAGYSFASTAAEPAEGSFTQPLRDTTIETNWYRTVCGRSKRVLDTINMLGTGSPYYQSLVFTINTYLGPILAHLAWCFYLPRLCTNLFVILKHTIPGSWMSAEEQSLTWGTRLQLQLQRRWFDLGNDVVWITAGVFTCFILVGALAPIAAYVTAACFLFDVAMAGLRTYIELTRLTALQLKYTDMLAATDDAGHQLAIQERLEQIKQKTTFEALRLGINTALTIAIVLAACCALSIVAVCPIIPLVGAVCLLAISLLIFVSNRLLDAYAPKEKVEALPTVAALGFFAKKNPGTSLPATTNQVDFKLT